MRPLFRLVIATVLVLMTANLVRAERAVPSERLTIGYEGEGKVDASPQACLATVKEITEWNEEQTKRGAREVCAARKKHVDAYAALQTVYRDFIRAVVKDRRYDWDKAASTVPTLVNTCIEHKFSITTGGHNIYIDIINNTVAADCLSFTAGLLREETRKLAH